jgi:hypothetical protein
MFDRIILGLKFWDLLVIICVSSPTILWQNFHHSFLSYTIVQFSVEGSSATQLHPQILPELLLFINAELLAYIIFTAEYFKLLNNTDV